MVTKSNKEEQIGFHKGALSVLALEQQEVFRISQIIQQQVQAHIKALKDLGIDIEKELKASKESIEKKLQ